MSFFAIVAFDAPDSQAKRIKYREEHVEALAILKKAGRLLAAGPLRASLAENADGVGSILIIKKKLSNGLALILIFVQVFTKR